MLTVTPRVAPAPLQVHITNVESTDPGRKVLKEREREKWEGEKKKAEGKKR